MRQVIGRGFRDIGALAVKPVYPFMLLAVTAVIAWREGPKEWRESALDLLTGLAFFVLCLLLINMTR
jgi:hypothetical protein